MAIFSSQSGLAAWLLASLLAAGLAVSRPVLADEFETVPAGDPIYAQLATVAKAGWLSAPRGSNQGLTRYEVALETAKAIFAVTAHHRADRTWDASASRPALGALRSLTTVLRVELKSLDVDAGETLTLLNGILKPGSGDVPARPIEPSGVVFNKGSAVTRPVDDQTRQPFMAAAPLTAFTGRDGSWRHVGSPNGFNMTNGGQQMAEGELNLPLSQRLRVRTAYLALAHAASDPFGDAASDGARLAQPNAPGGSSAKPSVLSAGANFSVTSWLQLGASYAHRTNDPRTNWLPDPLALGREEDSLNSNVDVVLGSLRLSGDYSHVSSDNPQFSNGTRIGGGVGLTAWQNRLSLNANLSRLVPEDSFALSQTAAALNIGVDVTQRMSLNLLYQQMFGAQNPARPDRVVAGGLSISF